MTTANNSGNGTSTGGTIILNPGTGTSINSGNGITVVPQGGWFTITVPTQPVQQQFTFDIDLAVPVEKKKKDRDGCDCKKCKEYFPYAEPNQEDGTLICYACRHGY